ncbi:hypothetical protein PTKIN_Ptkin12aG0160800 [Pterospermum kingtungense]
MPKDFCLCQLRELPKLFGGRVSSYAEEDNQDRPSPSLVPVPVPVNHVVSSLIKARLPVVEFRRSKWQGLGEQSAVCAICLACIEDSEEIRELGNCCHLYHRECVDGWVDQGHGTCPLCRLKLLPSEADDDEVAEGEKDPWRLERFAYLFGDHQN